LTEDLPFARAYHTPAFAPAIGPIREFFETLEIARLATPLYSCCSSGRFPDDAAAIRRLAVDQWTRPVEFRRTIEAMHADGLRVFVDVGARGNLAGFVEDTLRGRPSFAVAANLPRRSGLTQMNHLIASLFAQGLDMTPEFLFARRRPKPVALETPRPTPEIPPSAGLSETRPSTEPVPPSSNRSEEIGSMASADEVMQSYFATMNEFLRTQGAVMEGFLAGKVVGRENLVPSTPAPVAALGPWSGEVRRLDPGRAVEVVITLDAAGDPVAEHHTFGGRRVSAVDPDMKGLPVLPFTVMAEMLAQVAARLVPGRVLVGLREIKARRWVRYEAGPILLEIVAEADPDNPGEVRAALYNRGKSGLGDAPEVEGIIVFGDRRAGPPVSTAEPLASPEPSRFNARSMYAEQWLFHGPALRAVSEVGLIDDGGIDGMLRVLPRRGLYQDRKAPRPLTDPIVLDAFTHLLGLWGLDRLSEGDVVFPLRLGRLDVFGDDPPEGTDCPCRVRIRNVERLKITTDAEILRPDGTIWMRLTDWDDWRFYWPSRYRDVFRLPEHVLLGEPLDLPGVEMGEAVAIWLQPPGDMGRPVWRDVLEQCQLSPDERSGPLRPEGHEGRRTLRLWGRIAAKEAARRLWLDAGDPPVFPADLSILPDPHGRPVLRSRREPGREEMPAVSIAHTEGVAVAIASSDPHARIGIDVEKVTERSASFESAAFSPGERALLDLKGGGDRAEWIARLWCAKEAAAKATGFALIAGPSSVEVTSADDRGTIGVRIGPELAARCPGLGSEPITVHTQRKDEYLWAWTYRKVTGTAEGAHSSFRPQFSEADA
jgi:malonyl CoA-acyl carrier protein transacylase/phosphopantetheinyl transferase (holo-ACP synthase)